jgi:hypothetical protein
MGLLETIGMILFLIIVLPLAASFLMAVIMESANNEGLYDDEDY